MRLLARIVNFLPSLIEGLGTRDLPIADDIPTVASCAKEVCFRLWLHVLRAKCIPFGSSLIAIRDDAICWFRSSLLGGYIKHDRIKIA